MESAFIVWDQCLNILRNQVDEGVYDAWFAPIIPVKLEKSNFTIQVPSQFFYEYLDENYAELILQALLQVNGQYFQLGYQIEVKSRIEKKKEELSTKQDRKWFSNLDKRQTFENFFESDCNKIAYGIAKKIVSEPGKDFNPYFVYGNTGSGKTHLCHAMGNEMEILYPKKKVLYISTPSFQIQFTDATCNRRQNDFIRFYQQIDVLILDDVQELSGKEKTMQAYFHLFNHLHHLGKQLILTADKIPSEIEGLEERLISRFKWGLVMKMYAPDRELRKRIVLHKAQMNNISLSDEIVDYIIDHVTDSARDLEGVVNSLAVQSMIGEYEINLALAQKTVNEIIREKTEPVTVEKIQEVVCSYFRMAMDLIHSKSRLQEVVQARHISMFLAKKHTDSSYQNIGVQTGHRDHATALYAYRSIRERMNTDKSLRLTIDTIENILMN